MDRRLHDLDSELLAQYSTSEVKCIYTKRAVFVSPAHPSSPLLDILAIVPPGLGPSERIGRQVNWKHLRLTYNIRAAYNAFGLITLPVASTVRVLVVWHKCWSRSHVTSMAYYLDMPGYDPKVNVLTYYNYENTDKYEVLHDRLYFLTDKQCRGSSQGGTFDIPMKSKVSTYHPDETVHDTLDAVESGVIFIYAITDTGGEPTISPPDIYYTSRMLYTDE